MNETQVTIIGNVTADPELRFTKDGTPVANFSVAVTPRTFDKSEEKWVDGTTAFHRVTVWRDPAENVAEHVRKGKRVIVHGVLGQRNWETDDGEKRSNLEITASAVGLDLTFLKPVTPEPETTAERPETAKPAVKRQSPLRTGKDKATEKVPADA